MLGCYDTKVSIWIILVPLRVVNANRRHENKVIRSGEKVSGVDKMSRSNDYLKECIADALLVLLKEKPIEIL